MKSMRQDAKLAKCNKIGFPVVNISFNLLIIIIVCEKTYISFIILVKNNQ